MAKVATIPLQAVWSGKRASLSCSLFQLLVVVRF